MILYNIRSLPNILSYNLPTRERRVHTDELCDSREETVVPVIKSVMVLNKLAILDFVTYFEYLTEAL